MKKEEFTGEFEPEFIDGVKTIFEEKITFNKVMGLRITLMRPSFVTARLDMKPELVGHFSQNRIHGGVISACLDTLGALALMTAMGARHMDVQPQKRLERFAKLATIDLRVDYLRPGISPWFEMTSEVLRLGSRVGTARMEFKGADGKLMANGVGAYIVS